MRCAAQLLLCKINPKTLGEKGENTPGGLLGWLASLWADGCMMYPLMHPGRSDLHALVPVMDRLCPLHTQLPLLQLLTLSWWLCSSLRKWEPSVPPSIFRQTHLHLTPLFHLPSGTMKEQPLFLSEASPWGPPRFVALHFSLPHPSLACFYLSMWPSPPRWLHPLLPTLHLYLLVTIQSPAFDICPDHPCSCQGPQQPPCHSRLGVGGAFTFLLSSSFSPSAIWQSDSPSLTFTPSLAAPHPSIFCGWCLLSYPLFRTRNSFLIFYFIKEMIYGYSRI